MPPPSPSPKKSPVTIMKQAETAMQAVLDNLGLDSRCVLFPETRIISF